MKIGIITGSIREQQRGAGVAQWVHETAQSIGGAEFEVVKLIDFDLPLFAEPIQPAVANRQYAAPEARAWSQKMDEFDAYIFVTPEYNHSIPGAFKNAFDYLNPEWANKRVGFVSYGADGGVRAVEAWRLVVANAMMHDVRAQVSLGLFTEFTEEGVAPMQMRTEQLQTMINQLTA